MNDRDRSGSLISFLQRLEPIGDLLQAVAGDDLMVAIRIRDAERTVVLDLMSHPMRVQVDGDPLDWAAGLAGTAADLHQAFLGELGIMRGIGERRLLLRGGMHHLVRMFPVLELLPALYADHVFEQQRPAPGPIGEIQDKLIGFAQRGLGPAFTAAGKQLSRLNRRDLLAALTSLAQALASRSPLAAQPETGPHALGPNENHFLARPRPGPAEQRRQQALERSLAGLGAGLGAARYGLNLEVDLFDLLARLSRGIGQGKSGAAVL